MKTLFASTFFILFLTNFGFTQKALEKAEQAACKCITDKYDGNASYAANEQTVQTCITSAFMENINAFAEEYGADKMMDQKFSTQLGEKLGMNLVKNCAVFLEFSMQTAKEKGLDKQIAKTTDQTSGRIVNIQTGALTYIFVEDETGSQQKFLLLNYFDGANQYADLQSLKGKSATISWQLSEIYDHKKKGFTKSKEITGISLQ